MKKRLSTCNVKLYSFLICALTILCSCNTKRTPENVRELMESEGWEYCQMVETDLVYTWAGNTYIREGSTFDLFKKGADYVVTPPHTNTEVLHDYSHNDGYLTTAYWIRYSAFGGSYSVTGNLGNSENKRITTRNYTGRTSGDPHNNGARHYYRISDSNSSSLNFSDIESDKSKTQLDDCDPEINEPAKKYKQCPVCYGSGRCGGCAGTGSTYNSIDYSPGQYVDCGACGGSGECGACEGTGSVEDFGW